MDEKLQRGQKKEKEKKKKKFAAVKLQEMR